MFGRIAVVVLVGALGAALFSTEQAIWQRHGSAWEYVANGNVFVWTQPYSANPGDLLFDAVSFDLQGKPDSVTRIWYEGMDNNGIDLVKISFDATAGMKAHFERAMEKYKGSAEPRAVAIFESLRTVPVNADRSRFRLPAPPVVLRVQVMGVAFANISDKKPAASPNVALRIAIERETTLTAQLLTGPAS